MILTASTTVDVPNMEDARPRELSRFERFLRFHAASPHVYRLFEKFTKEAASKGKKVGARAVWERMRWELYFETSRDGDYKLNDHFTPYYARLVMLRNEQLAGYFETRDKRFDVDEATLLEWADKIDRPRTIPIHRVQERLF